MTSSASQPYSVDWRYIKKVWREITASEYLKEKIDAIPEVVDNVHDRSTDKALSANQWRLLQDQIDELKTPWKFLANWNSATWLSEVSLSINPYVYSNWDYFVVTNISDTTNYKPNWIMYTDWVASDVEETDAVSIDDRYMFNWNDWIRIPAWQRTFAVDQTLSDTSKNAVENRVIKAKLDSMDAEIEDKANASSGATWEQPAWNPGDIYVDEDEDKIYIKWVDSWKDISEWWWGGWGWGTWDYTGLTNKPSIEGVTLNGDKTADDLNLVNQKSIVTDLSSSSITLNNVAANTNYFYGTLSSLTITANDNSPLDSNIFFTTASTFTLTIPNTLKRNWSVSCEGGKKYRLNIYNNIATLNAIVDIAPKTITNIADSKTEHWPGYYKDSQTTTTKLNDYGYIILEVTPGEKIYFPYWFTAISCQFFNAARNQNLGHIQATDLDYSITVPSNSNIKYMSMPIRCVATNILPIAREKIANIGNLSPTIIHVQPWKASTLEQINRPTSWLSPNWYYTNVYNFAGAQTDFASGWHALYLESEDAYTSMQWYCIIGINPTTYEMLWLNLTGWHLVKFYADSYSELQNSFVTGIDMEKQATATTNRNFNTRALRITYGETNITIRDKFTNNVLIQIAYSDIDAVLPAWETYATTYTKKAIGTIYIRWNTYPDKYTVVAWQSTAPIVSPVDVPVEESEFPRKGKEWYAYGTSMTDESYNGYAVQLQKLTWMNIHNYGKWWSGIIPSLHDSDNVKTRCMRTTDGKTNADLITLEIIPNDMSGTLGESTDTWDDTFLGNLNQILQYLQENCPKAQIVVLTATRSRRSVDWTTENPPTWANATKWLQWEDWVAEVCRRNCVQFWNGWTACWLWYHRVKAATSGNTYVRDQIHLTPLGAENLAYFFYEKLKSLPLWKTSYDLA